MSPAKVDSPATVPQDEEATPFSAADFAAILSSTLAMAAEAGLVVGVRGVEANATRPAGILIYVSALTANAGQIAAPTPDPEPAP